MLFPEAFRCVQNDLIPSIVKLPSSCWPFLSVLFSSPVGHGQSEGERMNIKDFQIYIRDSLQHIDLMKSHHPGLPVFIVGHSMVGNLMVSVFHFINSFSCSVDAAAPVANSICLVRTCLGFLVADV